MSESIYNLIPRERPPVHKPSMHRSMFPGTLAPTGSTFGPSVTSQVVVTNLSGEFAPSSPIHNHRGNGSIGPPQSARSYPKEFLKKGSKHKTLPPPTTDGEYIRRLLSLPTVPPLSERPLMGLKTTKNYVKANAISNILSEPDKQNGDKNPYMMGKHNSFGNVPEYLHQVKAEIKEEYEYIHSLAQREEEQQKRARSDIKKLDEQERLELLEALKKKWDSVNRAYQTMTHIVDLDTITKIRTKEKHEADLSRLEKDIEKLSKKVVYVRDD